MTATLKAPAAGRETVDLEQDPPGNERGRDAAGTRGNRARGVADPAGSVKSDRAKNQIRRENEWQQLLQLTWRTRL